MLGFGDQMQMISLNGEFDDTELGSRSRGESTANDREDVIGAKAGYRRRGAQRHVDGMRRNVCGAAAMGHLSPAARSPLAACATTPATRCVEQEAGVASVAVPFELAN